MYINYNVHFWLKFHSYNLLSHGTRYFWMTGSVTHRNEIPTFGYLIAEMICCNINLVSCMCKYGLSLHNHFVLCLGLDQMDPNGTRNLCLASFVWPNMRAQWVGITKQIGCCLLHSGIRLPWIFFIEMIAYTFKFIMSQAHSSRYSSLKALSTTSSAKQLT